MVGAITPWNFPFEVVLAKLGQALATGNTVVLKPAPDTPWNATLIGRLVAERTDIPAGVLNVVTSSDHLVGEELTLSREVDLISFTGSTAVGKRIMEKGAATMKRLFLELGGKSATIVLDDADFDSALLDRPGGVLARRAGVCHPDPDAAPRSRYDEGVERLKSYLGMVPYGDPQREDVIMGPLISAKQRDRVDGLHRPGRRGGGHAGRRRRAPGGQPRGVFVEPTMFTDVDNSMTIAQEEIFGPVLVVIPFEDDDDAVRIANDSAYGLSGGVYSASLRPVDGGGPPGARRHHGRQRRHSGTAPTCPSEGSRTAASAGRTASPGSTSTSRSSRWRGRVPDPTPRGRTPVRPAPVPGIGASVLLSLTADQEFFRDTTARFLTEHAPPAEIRRLRDDPDGFDARYWRLGAELGWTSLLVDEEHGGGSISGDGVMDLTLVAHEFGRHAAPGSAGSDQPRRRGRQRAGGRPPRRPPAGLLDGTSIASWCYLEPRPQRRSRRHRHRRSGSTGPTSS